MSVAAIKPRPDDRYSATVSLRTDGETQVVQLPPEFRLDGNTVQVCRVEDGLLLKPVTAAKRWTGEELAAFWTRMDSYGADPLFPDGRDQGVFEIRDAIE